MEGGARILGRKRKQGDGVSVVCGIVIRVADREK